MSIYVIGVAFEALAAPWTATDGPLFAGSSIC